MTSMRKQSRTDREISERQFIKGNTMCSLGRHEEALENYERILDEDTTDPDTWYNRGDALRCLQRYEEAVQSFDRALELAPRRADVLHNKGETFRLAGRWTEAREALEKAVELGSSEAIENLESMAREGH